MTFGKIFQQIFESSIAQHYQTRHIFMDLVVLGWPAGLIDKTYEAIARIINVPVEIVILAISELEQPDPISRTPKANGARLVRLTGSDGKPRLWGWQIVNYELYRDMRSREPRKRDRKVYFRERRAKEKQAREQERNHSAPDATSPAQNAPPATTRNHSNGSDARGNAPRATTRNHRAPTIENKIESTCCTHTGLQLSRNQARKALTEFSRKHFIRVPSEAQWHNCFNSHLDEAMPLTQRDLEVLDWFYGLPAEQIEEIKTGRRREFANVMAYLSGEIQKAYAADKQLRTDLEPRKKNNPPKWREFLRVRYGDNIRLPADFDELDGDLRSEYEAGIRTFKEEA